MDFYNGVVSHLEPNILECEVKWALRSTAVNKASAFDEIPAELFRSLKGDAIKILRSLCLQIWKTQQWPQDWKREILIPIPKKGNTKECVNHQTITLISHASKVMLKYTRLQHYANQELQMSKLGLEKEEKSEVKSEVAQSCPTLCDPMDCSLPRSSIHGIFQARVLEWVAI